MNAIYKRELRSFFTNILGYLLVAFVLLIFGLFFKSYNLTQASPYFESVLAYSTFIYLILIPILTMRTFSEERKQKTDQLLYTAPVSIGKVVLGKYLALISVLAVPLLISCFYPLIMSLYGKVAMLTAYTSIFGFFLLGAALSAIGMFISTLTENQIIAALLSFAITFLGYWAVNLSGIISTTKSAALFMCSAIVLILVFVLRNMTQNWTLSLSIGIILELGLLMVYMFYPQALSGLTVWLLDWIAIFAPFNLILNGIFDLTAVIYYLSIICLFVFLSVQSVEKRRWS